MLSRKKTSTLSLQSSRHCFTKRGPARAVVSHMVASHGMFCGCRTTVLYYIAPFNCIAHVTASYGMLQHFEACVTIDAPNSRYAFRKGGPIVEFSWSVHALTSPCLYNLDIIMLPADCVEGVVTRLAMGSGIHQTQSS